MVRFLGILHQAVVALGLEAHPPAVEPPELGDPVLADLQDQLLVGRGVDDRKVGQELSARVMWEVAARQLVRLA